MMTGNVTYASNGSTANGYLAEPDGAGPYLGVVVIQEWWGLNAHIQDVTRRMAETGAVALSPDLYHGAVATEPDEARKLVMELNREQAIKEIGGAVEFLRQHSKVQPKKIGVIGFCMGGGLAEQAGARIAGVGAAVAFYGGNPPNAEDFTNTDVAILSLVGENDTGVLERQRGLETALQGSPVRFELVTYPDAGHAFLNDTRPEAYDADVANDAWTRALDWLHTYLRG